MSEHRLHNIVVGTDFNDLSTAAMRLAGRIAARSGAALTVVYADTFEPPAEFTAAQVKQIVDQIERSRSRTREQLERHIRQHVPDIVEWKAVVAEGLPATVLAAIADEEHADFIALGTHGRGGLQRLILGSVAESVMREAHVPVLTVRSTSIPEAIRRILSDTGVVDEATRIARALEADLTVMHFAPEELEEGGFDLIVAGMEQKLARHAHAPVLTVTRSAVRSKASATDGVVHAV